MAHQMATEMLGHWAELSIESLPNDGYDGEAWSNSSGQQSIACLPACTGLS